MGEFACQLSCFMALAASIGAQQFAVVPAAYSTQEGNSRTLAAGVMGEWREQVIIGASHLSGLAGSDLHAVELRRHGFDEPFPAGAGHIVLKLSHTMRAPLSISNVFADNEGSPAQVVFDGVVAVQTSPAPGASVPAWSADNTLRIQFTSPFFYQGGNLCIEIVGTKVNGLTSALWPVDAVAWQSDAQRIDLGPGTGPNANDAGKWLFVPKAELTAGGQVDMMAVGPVGSLALAFVGRASAVPIPLSLVGIQTPGGFAYLDEIYLSQLAFFQAPSVPVTDAGLAYWDLLLPNEPWILGVDIAAQWFELLGSNPSNGVRMTIGSTVPTLDMARVVSVPSSPVGSRSVTMAPIFRFEYTTH